MMSKQTWKDEFYPAEAKEAKEHNLLWAIRHSRMKWEGLTEENLDKHDVAWDDVFFLAHCALCAYYNADNESKCASCPLALLGKDCGTTGSVFLDSYRNCKPQPLVDALKECERIEMARILGEQEKG